MVAWERGKMEEREREKERSQALIKKLKLNQGI